jgi:hypothetical protein
VDSAAESETSRTAEGRSKRVRCKAREESFPRRTERYVAGKATRRNAADDPFSSTLFL